MAQLTFCLKGDCLEAGGGSGQSDWSVTKQIVKQPYIDNDQTMDIYHIHVGWGGPLYLHNTCTVCVECVGNCSAHYNNRISTDRVHLLLLRRASSTPVPSRTGPRPVN